MMTEKPNPKVQSHAMAVLNCREPQARPLGRAVELRLLAEKQSKIAEAAETVADAMREDGITRTKPLSPNSLRELAKLYRFHAQSNNSKADDLSGEAWGVK